MNAYDALAGSYDALTYDVPYEKVLAFWETVLHGAQKAPESVLDLACGTGSLTALLAARGYRVFAADLSEEMLAVASEKLMAQGGAFPSFFRCGMESLRLPEQVHWIVSCLDGVNYLTEDGALEQTFRRAFDNLTDGGVFTFDVNSLYKLRGLDGQVFLDENEDTYCVWRTEFEEETKICFYGVDLFTREGENWRRDFEEHRERAYTEQELRRTLERAGFTNIRVFGDCRAEPPAEDEMRLFFYAEKGKSL